MSVTAIDEPGRRSAADDEASHHVVYDAPALYHLAFSYRDFTHEVSLLLGVFQDQHGRLPRSFLELAAGPGWHAIEMARRGIDVVALDLAAAMARFATEKAKQHGVNLPYLVADMVDFEAGRTFELAGCMLRSSGYLCSDKDFIKHLRTVARALVPGGMYVLEMALPSEMSGEPIKNVWTVRDDDGGVLDGSWELIGRHDPQTRIHRFALRLAYQPAKGAPTVVEDYARQRGYSRADVEALVRESGVFVVDDVLGELDRSVAFDDPQAWRMVVILRKK